MAKQTINLGTAVNDGSGDPLRTAFDKVNDNFDELYLFDSNVAGDDTQVLFNDGEAFGADSDFTYNKTTNALTVAGNVTGGNLTTGAQVVATGNVTGGNLNTGAQVIATGNITGGNVAGTRGLFTNIAGTLETAAQTNITSLGTLSAVTVTANITGGNLITGAQVVATGNVTGGNLITGAQVIATGNVTGGNINTGAQVVATGNVTGGNINTGGNVTGNYIKGDGSLLTNVVSSVSPAGLTTQVQFNDGGTTGADAGLTYAKATDALTATGNITGGNLTTGAQVVATGNITGGNLITGAQVVATGNVTGGNINTGAQVVATGNVTGGNLITAGLVSAISFAKTGVDGTGNIGQTDNAFDTVHATATSAQYADLAENYEADKQYEPGTILAFGGEKEVTCADTTNTQAIAGIVSTLPAHLMNSQCEGEHVIALALTGRVPCKVIGPIQKGEMVVISQQKGIGTGGGLNPLPGSVVGKSLEYVPKDEDTVENPTVHDIEVVVGRL